MISSFTAAEYGDLRVLQNRLTKAAGKCDSSTSYFMDSDGYTLLHYAAQQNKIAATRYILGFCFNDEIRLVLHYSSKDHGGCGATPLHRAAFAGSVGAMCVLLDAAVTKSVVTPKGSHEFKEDEQTCRSNIQDLLFAKDVSFGDEMTALHKSISGGRYMAVKVLLDYCSEENDGSLLSRILMTKDSEGRTPLQLAKDKVENGESPDDLARWDASAGGKADWTRCKLLLEEAEKRTVKNISLFPSGGGAFRNDDSQKYSATCLRSLPKHLLEFKSCLDCGVENGTCQTKAWEDAFRLSLLSSIETKIHRNAQNLDKAHQAENLSKSKHSAKMSSSPVRINGITCTVIEDTLPALQLEREQHKKETGMMGRPCSSCNVLKLVLFRRPDGELICQTCKSLKKKNTSWLR